MSTIPTPTAPRVTQKIPGLRRSLPFYALKPWVKLGSPILLFEHLLKTYGNIAQYRFMGTPIIFINDPHYIQSVLVHDAHRYVKERTVRRMKVLLGEGLITSDDPIHIRQRRIAAPAFHRQRIAAYADRIVSIAAHHRDQWQPGQTIDIAAASMALSLEIVARTLFDTEVTPDIRAINDEVNTIMGLYNFIVAFPRIESFLHLPIPGITKFRRSKARLDAVVNRLITEHREAAVHSERGHEEKEEKIGGDLLSMLLASTYEPTEAEAASGKQPERMSDTQVRDEVLTIFLAGYETVANALTWTWYLLSQNPEAEAKLHAELDTVLGPGTLDPGPLPTDYQPWPTTQTSATQNKSSPNPCASTHPPGPWAAWPSKTPPSAPTTSPPAPTSSSANTSCPAPPSTSPTRSASTPTASPPKPKPPAPNSPTSPSAAATANASASPSPGWKASSPSPPSPNAGA